MLFNSKKKLKYVLGISMMLGTVIANFSSLRANLRFALMTESQNAAVSPDWRLSNAAAPRLPTQAVLSRKLKSAYDVHCSTED